MKLRIYRYSDRGMARFILVGGDVCVYFGSAWIKEPPYRLDDTGKDRFGRTASEAMRKDAENLRSGVWGDPIYESEAT